MANVSRISGFRPVKHITGAPYNGQANIYEVPAGEAIPVFVGDLVRLFNFVVMSYFPAVEAAVTAAVTSGVYIGAVVGIINSKMDPINGSMTAGSISLDTPQYRAASTKQFVLVADAPDLIFEAEADAAVALASNVATTNSLPLQIVGIPNRVDNEPNASYNKVWVRINTHALSPSGVTAV